MITALDIAQVCHEANRAYQLAAGDPAPSPHWDAAPKRLRDSVVDGVNKALAGASPEQLHESWCDFKTADGWVYGPVKDELALTHPCLVPYDQLPHDQRTKDDLFQVIVTTLKRP